LSAGTVSTTLRALTHPVRVALISRLRRPVVVGLLAYLAEALCIGLAPYLGSVAGVSAAMVGLGIANGFANVLTITAFQRWASPGTLGRLRVNEPWLCPSASPSHARGRRSQPRIGAQRRPSTDRRTDNSKKRSALWPG
jgi:hypothetical protein